MTREEREEAIIDIRDNIKPVVGGKSLDMALEALEQEPCTDAISRQAVLDCLTATGLKKYDFILNARDKIKNLPSVRPQEPFDIETYCKEHFMVMVDKDVWEKAEKALKQEPILEKIRAEIEELDTHYDNDYFVGNKDAMFKCDEVMQIIDRYRGEVDCRECKAEYECYYCKKYEENEG